MNLTVEFIGIATAHLKKGRPYRQFLLLGERFSKLIGDVIVPDFEKLQEI